MRQELHTSFVPQQRILCGGATCSMEGFAGCNSANVEVFRLAGFYSRLPAYVTCERLRACICTCARAL